MKIFDSFWNPAFYKNKEGVFSFWKAFGRIILLNVIISIVYAAIFHGLFGRNIPAYLISFGEKIETGYPSELVLTIKDGQLSKNVKGDLKLYPLSSFSISGKPFFASSTTQYLIDINDEKEASLASFSSSSAMLFIGRDGVVVKNNNDMRVYPYKGAEGVKKDVVFSKDTLKLVVDTVSKYVNIIPVVLFVAIVALYTLFVTLGYLIVVLFIGLIIMLLSVKLLGNKTAYRESYILSLYALPSVVIVNKVLMFIPYVSGIVPKIPFFTTLMVILFIWYMFKEKLTKDGVLVSS